MSDVVISALEADWILGWVEYMKILAGEIKSTLGTDVMPGFSPGERELLHKLAEVAETLE